MSDYNRLISYVYMYREGEKTKNVGFVKIESRNGQCKIGISLKGIHSGNIDLDVFLFAYQKKILVGKIYIRNGQGELRIVTEQENLVGSGESLDSMGGLKMENQTISGIYYATIWDDELVEQQNRNIGFHVAQLEEAVENAMEFNEVEVKEIEVKEDMELEEGILAIESEEDFIEVDISTEKVEAELEMTEEFNPAATEFQYAMDEEFQSEFQPEFQLEQQSEFQPETQPMFQPEQQSQIQPEEQQSLWENLSKQFPKTQCFASDKPHEILAIQPQDIGVLPRDAWVYGNNSFLLHGYYQYRYLIVVKMKVDEERDKYLLGVPGIYHNNERFMATMFGFSNFYLAKRQSPKMGQFGYWCTEIKMS